MGNSIFEFADKFGYESLWDKDWVKENSVKASSVNKKETSDIPNVKLVCSKLNKLPINTEIELLLQIEGASKKDLFGKYDVELICNNAKVTLSTNKFVAEKGWKLITFINSSVKGKITLQIKVDDTNKNSISFIFFDSKDVFNFTDAQKGIYEILKIAGKVKGNPTSGEYKDNYCIQAADRFLGAVINNKTDFYAYDDVQNKKINVPSLNTAIDRANKIKAKGFAYDFKEISGSEFKLININTEDQYSNNPTRKLSLPPNNKFINYFFEIIDERYGIHIFYLSIANAFHTEILVVNYLNPCSPIYAIFDEEGLTSSEGSLSNIDTGILNQSEWVYRWVKSKPKYGYWTDLKVSILKFQKK